MNIKKILILLLILGGLGGGIYFAINNDISEEVVWYEKEEQVDVVDENIQENSGKDLGKVSPEKLPEKVEIPEGLNLITLSTAPYILGGKYKFSPGAILTYIGKEDYPTSPDKSCHTFNNEKVKSSKRWICEPVLLALRKDEVAEGRVQELLDKFEGVEYYKNDLTPKMYHITLPDGANVFDMKTLLEKYGLFKFVEPDAYLQPGSWGM